MQVLRWSRARFVLCYTGCVEYFWLWMRPFVVCQKRVKLISHKSWLIWWPHFVGNKITLKTVNLDRFLKMQQNRSDYFCVFTLSLTTLWHQCQYQSYGNLRKKKATNRSANLFSLPTAFTNKQLNTSFWEYG